MPRHATPPRNRTQRLAAAAKAYAEAVTALEDYERAPRPAYAQMIPLDVRLKWDVDTLRDQLLALARTFK